jgi:hypothetical protein
VPHLPDAVARVGVAKVRTAATAAALMILCIVCSSGCGVRAAFAA